MLKFAAVLVFVAGLVILVHSCRKDPVHGTITGIGLRNGNSVTYVRDEHGHLLTIYGIIGKVDDKVMVRCKELL